MKLSHFMFSMIGLMALTILSTVGGSVYTDSQLQASNLLAIGALMFVFEALITICGFVLMGDN